MINPVDVADEVLEGHYLVRGYCCLVVELLVGRLDAGVDDADIDAGAGEPFLGPHKFHPEVAPRRLQEDGRSRVLFDAEHAGGAGHCPCLGGAHGGGEALD